MLDLVVNLPLDMATGGLGSLLLIFGVILTLPSILLLWCDRKERSKKLNMTFVAVFLLSLTLFVLYPFYFGYHNQHGDYGFSRASAAAYSTMFVLVTTIPLFAILSGFSRRRYIASFLLALAFAPILLRAIAPLIAPPFQ